MTASNWFALFIGGVIGSAITSGIIAFSEPDPVCQNEVFSICTKHKVNNGLFAPTFESGKIDCKTFPTKIYKVETVFSPFGKRITNKLDPTETILYQVPDYISTDFVCTDTATVNPTRK